MVPGILRLAAENSPYHLAVSLHGSNEEERSALVPASKKWPLEMLIDACRTYVNDHRQAHLLRVDADRREKRFARTPPAASRRLLEGIDSHINLIPLNPTGGFSGEASETRPGVSGNPARRGFPCTFRQRRGIDVAAGCGMLKADRFPTKSWL